MKPGIAFQVTGKPVPKQSTRFGNKRAYLDPKIEAWQQAVTWEAKAAAQMADWDMLTGDVAARLIFYLPDRRRRDIDNLSKAVLDAMNGIIYKDDTQVQKLVVDKKVSRDKPGVFVIVRPIDG